MYTYLIMDRKKRPKIIESLFFQFRKQKKKKNHKVSTWWLVNETSCFMQLNFHEEINFFIRRNIWGWRETAEYMKADLHATCISEALPRVVRDTEHRARSKRFFFFFLVLYCFVWRPLQQLSGLTPAQHSGITLASFQGQYGVSRKCTWVNALPTELSL